MEITKGVWKFLRNQDTVNYKLSSLEVSRLNGPSLQQGSLDPLNTCTGKELCYNKGLLVVDIEPRELIIQSKR